MATMGIMGAIGVKSGCNRLEVGLGLESINLRAYLRRSFLKKMLCVKSGSC